VILPDAGASTINLQGYLTYKKTHSTRTLPYAYA